MQHFNKRGHSDWQPRFTATAALLQKTHNRVVDVNRALSRSQDSDLTAFEPLFGF
jgi:hypothetical protein